MSLLIPRTFCGMETSPEKAKLVVYGAPFDGTTSFRPGTRFASERMRRDSWGLETYSPYLNDDLERYPIGDAGDLDLPHGDVAAAIEAVETMATRLLVTGICPVMLGGEHSLSLGLFRAALAHHQDLHLIHFDAHADLRDAYRGQPLSHASVIRRIADLIDPQRIHSFGIRSGLKEEWDYARQRLDFHPFTLDNLVEILDGLHGIPLYVTIDLDVLDPSFFPATGTPEPGGISYLDLQAAVHNLAGSRVVAADLMELSPPLDMSGASTAVACKLLRELCLILMRNVSS